MKVYSTSLCLLLEASANKREEERNLRENVEAILWLYASGLLSAREKTVFLLRLADQASRAADGEKKKEVIAHAIQYYAASFS